MSVLFDRVKGGFSGSRTRRVLGICVLIVVTAGAVVMAVVSLTRSLSSEERPRTAQKMHFQCAACGHEFDISAMDYSAWAAEAKPTGGNFGRANCPKCGGKFTGALMERCPKCGKYYSVQEALQPVPGIPALPRCPHCGAVPGGARPEPSEPSP